MKERNKSGGVGSINKGFGAGLLALSLYCGVNAFNHNSKVSEAKDEITAIEANDRANMDPAVVAENIRNAQDSSMPTVSSETAYGSTFIAEKDIEEQGKARDTSALLGVLVLGLGAAAIAEGIVQGRRQEAGNEATPILPTPTA